MERNANYALVGFASLVLLVGLAAFVLWLAQVRFARDYDLYDNGSLSEAAATFCVFIGIIAAVLAAVAVARLAFGLRRRAARRRATRQAALTLVS